MPACRLRGHLPEDPSPPNPGAEQVPLLAGYASASVQEQVTSGPRAGHPVRRLRSPAAIADFRPAAVYIDVLRKVTLRDLNKAAEAGALLAELDRLRRAYAVLFRIVAHYRKLQGGYRAGRGSQELGGPYVLGAWGENSLFFEPIGRRAGAVRVEVQSKDGAPQPPFALRIESEGSDYAPTSVTLTAEDTTAESKSEANKDRGLQVLATLLDEPAVNGKPGVSWRAVSKAVKLSERPTKDAIKALEAEGKVSVAGKA